jgi:glycosyltransferase involved in cell wall biosynthesis
MVRRFARKRLISLRRSFGQTRGGRTVQRWRRARLSLPRSCAPNAALLPESAEELALTPELRDRTLLADAIAWAEARGPRASEGCAAVRARPTSAAGRRIQNVLLISHCDFTGNSALHVYRIGAELHARGLSPVIAVPDDPETVEDLGRPPFHVVSYGDVRAGQLRFPDGRGPDLVHAFTPRERVRKLASALVAAVRCPYVVHLEDNDLAVLSAELDTPIDQLQELPAALLDRFVGPGQVHPQRGPHFVRRAAGVSVVIDALLELTPADLPAAVVKPGFDEAVLSPDRDRADVRAELGIRPEDCAVVYTGTINTANLSDMRRLYVALAALRRDGHPIVFVRTGWNAPDAPELRHLGDGVRNLGWVPRASLPAVLAAADVLVQPGVPGPFNDYRFPAKLPDFLASGKPVIVSRTNLGRVLEDGREALVLESGNAAEIYRAIESLLADPRRASEIGEHGREFALRELRWSTSVDALEVLYGDVEPARSTPPWALELDPPVKVVALVPDIPAAVAARTARQSGIYGFCFPIGNRDPDLLPEFPFCFYVSPSDEELLDSAVPELSDPAYITVGGAPLLLCDDTATTERWRRAAETAGLSLHLSVVERPAEAGPQQLAVALPDDEWFRCAAYFEGRPEGVDYMTSIRKLVLQALGRASVQEPLLFVEPGSDAPHSWLAATFSGLRDGIERFYASRGLDVTPRSVERMLRPASR